MKLPKSWKNCEVLQVVATVAAVNQKRQQKTGGKWDGQHKHKQCKKQTNNQSGMKNTNMIIIIQTKNNKRTDKQQKLDHHRIPPTFARNMSLFPPPSLKDQSMQMKIRQVFIRSHSKQPTNQPGQSAQNQTYLRPKDNPKLCSPSLLSYPKHIAIKS